MCSNIFKYLFKSKSKKETEEPDLNAFRSRAEPMQEQRRRLFNIDEEWEEEYEASFDTGEEDELLAFESFNIRDEPPSTPDSLKWRKQGAKPRNISDTCSSNSYFSYENARRRRPLSREAIDYQPTFSNAAKKLSEGKQSLEKPDAKEDEKFGMDKEEKLKYKKMAEKETNALFMLEEEYHSKHQDSYGWTL